MQKKGMSQTFKFKIWWRRFTTRVKISTSQKKHSVKRTGGEFLLKRRTFLEICGLHTEATTASFHSSVSDKFKCLSHADCIACTAVQAFLSDVCAGALTLLPEEISCWSSLYFWVWSFILGRKHCQDTGETSQYKDVFICKLEVSSQNWKCISFTSD